MRTRYDSCLQLPLLDTFPDIYSKKAIGRTSLPILAALSTTSAVATGVQNLQRLVANVPGLESRETLSNGLAEIAAGYTEGFESGSETDEDD